MIPPTGSFCYWAPRKVESIIGHRWRTTIPQFTKTSSVTDPGLLIIEAPGEIVHVNARAAELLGRSPGELCGPIKKNLAGFEITDTRGRRLALNDLPGLRALESGKPVEDALLGLHQSDGAVLWVSATAEPLIRRKEGSDTVLVTLRPVNRMMPGKDPLSKYREWLRWATQIRQVFEFENDFVASLKACMELMARASEASSIAYITFKGGLRSGFLQIRQYWADGTGFDDDIRAAGRLNLGREPYRDWLAVLRAAEVLEISGSEVPHKMRRRMGMLDDDHLVVGFLQSSRASPEGTQALIALIRPKDRGSFNPFELDIFRLILSSMANELGRQMAEQAQKRQMNRFRRLFRVTPLVIAVMELKGALLSIVEVSNAGGGFVSANEQDLVGRSDAELGYSEDICEMRRAAARRSMKESRPVRIEYERAQEGASSVWEEATFSYLDSHQRSHFFSVAVRDITREKLEQRQKAQKQKLEAMGRFTSAIAHDLNNLLQPPLIYVAESIDLIKDLPGSMKPLEKLEIAMNGLGRSRQLVRRLLTFTRQGNAEKGAIDIFVSLPAVVDSYRAALPSNVTLELSRNGDNGWVGLSDSGVEQIAVNLIRNSARAMSADGGKIKVNLSRTETESGGFAITVEDNGPGIPAQVVERIFEPFFSGNADSSGTGLGLSIVQSIVTDAGGSIEVESSPGKGSLMRILLPEVESRPEVPKEPLELASELQMNFCLIDDDMLVAAAVTSGLQRMGQNVRHFHDPDEALTAFQQGYKPDLLVLDQVLGEKRGADYSMRFSKYLPGRIIMVSGNPDLTPAEAQDLGIGAILTKPVFPDELMAAALSLTHSSN